MTSPVTVSSSTNAARHRKPGRYSVGLRAAVRGAKTGTARHAHAATLAGRVHFATTATEEQR